MLHKRLDKITGAKYQRENHDTWVKFPAGGSSCLPDACGKMERELSSGMLGSMLFNASMKVTNQENIFNSC